MRYNRYYIIAVMLLLLPVLASCRKDLCYNHFPAVNVSLAWEREWERDYGMSHINNWDSEFHGFGYDYLRPEMPEWVTLVKYSDDTNPDEKYLTPNGGQFVIDGGANYSFLLYNGDTEYIVLSDMASLPDARASATGRSRTSIASVMERHPNSRTTNPPDILYSAFIKDVPAVQVHELRQVPVKMQPLVYTYLIRYEFEYGIENVTMARGALGGMAESVYLRDGVTSDQSTIILYDCDVKPYGCVAHVKSFGVPGFPDEYYGRTTTLRASERPYTLNLEVLLKNNRVHEFNFDISDQLVSQPRGGVITVSGLRIDDDEVGFDSGFKVDVSDWGQHEEIDLPVSAK